MASSTKDKDKSTTKTGHRRPSSSKTDEQKGPTPTRNSSTRKPSAPQSTANSHVPPQNGSRDTGTYVMPRASKPTPTTTVGAAGKNNANNNAPSRTANPTMRSPAHQPPNTRRSSAPTVGPQGAGATGADGVAPGPQQNAMGGYGSMGAGGMKGGYGSMGPSMMNGSTMNPYGSMGPGGYGSMAAGQSSMNGGYNSMMGGDGSMSGVGGNSGYGSMYGMGVPMGSMYGMGGPMGSMYGMGAPMGGSMYGMGAPMVGSMYGIGGAMGGSMYAMGGAPMYGGMNSMYGMGSMYGFGRYNSMGLGSSYASLYGLGRSSSRSSFRSTGGYIGGSFGGLWRAPSSGGYETKKDYSIPPPSSKLSEVFPDDDEDQKEQPQTSKRNLPANAVVSKDDAKSSNDSAAADKKGERTPVSERGEKGVTPVSERGEKKGVTPSVVVVDNASNKAEKQKSRSVPLALASSHRLTKQVNDNVHVVVVAPNESMANKADKSVTIGSIKYAMDEVAISPVDIEKSDLLTDILEQTHCGHNVSLLALCGRQNYEASIPTVKAVVRCIMDSFIAEDTQVTQVMASAVVFPDSDKIVDLLVEGDQAKPVMAELGSNPIYGPCVMNTSEKKVETADEAVAVIESAAKKAAQRGLVVVTYKIKQVRPPSGHSTTRDVYVSSMLVAIVDDANMVYVKAAEKHGAASPTPLFGNAIGGASRTVAIVQIPEKDAENSVGDALASAQKLREIKNTPTRSGNVKRFIDYTERAAAANAKTSPETTEKIKRMLNDAKELLERPEETSLVAYNLHGGSHAASPSTIGGASPQKAQSQEISAAPVADAAEDDNKKPEAERRVKLTVCVNGTKGMRLGEVDEVVIRSSPKEVPESAMLKSLRTNFRYGRNIALISAETQPDSELRNQYTWRCVDRILSKCLAEPVSMAKTTTVELFMVVIQRRQVLCDLIAKSSTPKQMAIASSPLFGPIIADTKHKTLREATEVQPTLDQALAMAPPYLKEMDALIVMTAVLKQIQESGDVAVASFMCASGPSGAGVRGAMSKDPEYSRSLFAYAIGGPCVTTLLVSVGDDHDTNATAKSSLDDLLPLTKQLNHASRDGSVNNFLDYAKKSIEANGSKMERATTEEEKDRLKMASSQLHMMHDDYKAVVKFPQDNTPAYYIGERRVSEAPRMGGKPVGETSATATSNGSQPASTAIRSVVVVVDDNGGGGVMAVTEKEIVLDGERYTPSEVVTSKGGMLRSAVIDEAHKVALNGYNVAVLTNDVANSTVGISLTVKTIDVILRGLPQNSEAFWTVVVSKENKVKDMLADNSPYYDLHLASSPLFGNVAYGANISPVTEAQVEPMVRKVRNEVRENGGVGYIYVILRITQTDGDVCMSSFLSTIAGDNADEYAKVLETRGNRRLLSTAIGGPCHTTYVAGIRGLSGEGAKPMLDMARKMMTVQNAPLRSGSLKRFIAHTEPTLAGMQRKLDAEGGSNATLMAQVGRIGTMLRDARNMLNSPGGSVPAVYKR